MRATSALDECVSAADVLVMGVPSHGFRSTLEEVAKAYGITRERIRQIEARGLLKLRQPLRSKRLAEFAETE